MKQPNDHAEALSLMHTSRATISQPQNQRPIGLADIGHILDPDNVFGIPTGLVCSWFPSFYVHTCKLSPEVCNSHVVAILQLLVDLENFFVAHTRGCLCVLHVPAPLREGGLGLHQMFWSHCAQFVTMMQSTLRAKHSSPVHNVNNVLPSHATPIHNYPSILNQLGARTTLHIASPERPAGGPELFDSESSDDGAMLHARTPQVGDP